MASGSLAGALDGTAPPPAAVRLFRRWIHAGQVYGVRRLAIPGTDGPNPEPAVYLVEIENPIEPETGMEYGYLAYRF